MYLIFLKLNLRAGIKIEKLISRTLMWEKFEKNIFFYLVRGSKNVNKR